MLSAENHTKWKHAIKATALSAGAWGIINGTSMLPNTAPTDAGERKENRDWERCREQVSGSIFSTLDEAHQSMVADIDPVDANALSVRLNEQYKKKDIGGQFFAMQNLMAITYRDADHTMETLFEFGNCVIDGSKKLRDLIPDAPTIIPAMTTAAVAVCTDMATHVATVTPGVITPATLGSGFTARDLIDELAINVILIGLGRSEEVQQLKHTAIQTGVKSLTDVLTALQKADTLNKSDEMSTASASALVAQQTRRTTGNPTPSNKGKGKFYCHAHGQNKSHI